MMISSKTLQRFFVSALAVAASLGSYSTLAQTYPELGVCKSFYPANYRLAEGRLNPNPVSMLKPLKGQVFAEPNFGTCEVRATDHANEAPVNFARNDYSRRQAFNANDTRFIVYSNDGFWHLYDANTLQHLKRLAGPAGDAEPQWDPGNASRLLYLPTNGGTQIMALDVESNTSQVLVNFAGRLPGWAANARHIWTKSEGSPSADGRYWGFQVEDANFNLLGYVTWDLQTDQMVGAMQSSSRPDHVSMSPSGRWFTISGAGTWAWSLDFSQKKKLHNGGEHSDLALLDNGHDAYASVDFQTNAGDIFFTDIDACPSVPATATTAAVCPRTVLFEDYVNGATTSIHISGKGYNKPGWVLFSTYGDEVSRDGTRPWYTNKVFIVELKANPRIYPLAYTHRQAPSGSFAYWTEPHASVNRNFTRMAYNTNWHVNSETDLDAYIVHIPANSFGDAGPPVEPVCTRAAASLALTGNTTAVAAGTAVTYTATLRNQDSAACAASSFTLAPSVPAGWGSSLSTSSLSLSAGASTTATWTVTSLATSTAGAYPLALQASSALPEQAATAQVTYQVAPATPACTRNVPLVTLTGSTAAVQAGTAITYQVRLTNQDTAQCASTSFALAASVPANWGKTLSASSLTLAPGASQTANLTVASSGTAVAGGYPLYVATSSGHAAHAANTSITYTVAAAPVCTRRAPLVALTGPGADVVGGTAVVYQAKITNQDSAQCGNTAFSLASSAPSGWGKSLSASSLNIAPGASKTANLTITSPASAAAGIYTVGAASASGASTLHTRSATTSYRVKAAPVVCVRNKPSVVIGTPTNNGTGQTTYPITVKNLDTSACASTYFGLNAKQPAGSSGWGLNLIQGGNTVAPGANWVTSLVVTPPINLARGQYQIPLEHSSQQGAHGGTVYVGYTKSPRVTGGNAPVSQTSAKAVSAAKASAGTGMASKGAERARPSNRSLRSN